MNGATPDGVWLTVVLMGVLTFALRFSFLAVPERRLPPYLERALRYVPPAVLAALVAPAVFTRGGSLDLSLGNERMLAALFALLIAWRTRSVLWTILGGMLALWALRAAGL